jgi:sulfite reductase (NADPH) flavoprotein alpha-component
MVAAALMPLFMVTGFMLYLSRRKHRRMSRPPVGSLVPGE